MFKRIQVSKVGIRLALVLSAHLSLGLDASDPCSNRKFCGNLTIIYNGAGENYAEGENKGKDPAAIDTSDYLNAIARKGTKNSKILLLSSDTSPGVATAIESAQKNMGANFTHIPTARPSFDEYLKNDTKLDAIKRAFAADPDCQELMRLNPNEDISKFVKVDILVASHSQGKGDSISLPAWPSDSDKGEDDLYKELIDSSPDIAAKAAIVSKDFDQFRNTFAKSVFHALPLTCDGADIAEMILPRNSDTCACSVAYTDSGIVSVRDYSLDYGVLVDALHTYKKDEFKGVPSLSALGIPLQNYNRWKLMRATTTGVGNDAYSSSIFTIDTKKTNPFDLFSLSSAEKVAEDVEVSVAPVEHVPGVKLVSAKNLDKEFENAYREVLALINRNQNQNAQYLATIKRNPVALKESREAAKDFFNSCIVDTEGAACAGFKDVLNRVYSNRNSDRESAEVYALFEQVQADLGSMAKSPLLEGNVGNPITFLPHFDLQSKHFDEFAQALTRAARKLGMADKVVSVLDDMSVKWATYHSAFITAYYPDVMKDTLDRRVESLSQAAELLRAKYAETNDPRYKKKLERLRSQLACLLNFPIGPNYREVNEFPVGSLVVDSSNSSGSPIPKTHVDGAPPPKPSSNETPALR